MIVSVKFIEKKHSLSKRKYASIFSSSNFILLHNLQMMNPPNNYLFEKRSLSSFTWYLIDKFLTILRYPTILLKLAFLVSAHAGATETYVIMGKKLVIRSGFPTIVL